MKYGFFSFLRHLCQRIRAAYTVCMHSISSCAVTSHVIDQHPLHLDLDDDLIEEIAWLKDHPLSFMDVHCAPSRELLGWNIDDLSLAAGVSPQAIQRLECDAHLRTVSLQALAFVLEAEGLVFFPDHPPLRGMNCRGSTKDPRSRLDYHLLG